MSLVILAMIWLWILVSREIVIIEEEEE